MSLQENQQKKKLTKKEELACERVFFLKRVLFKEQQGRKE